MKTKYSTEERKQYRRDQMAQLEEELREGVSTFFTSARFREFLSVMSRFHDYSFNNCVLIGMQRPDATYVAGYNSWRKDFHRIVKKGEKGIRIFRPMTLKEKDDQTGEETPKTLFRPAYVFDISQTTPIEGMEPVELNLVPDLSGSVADYDLLIAAIVRVADVPVSFEEVPGSAKGYYAQKGRRIVIQEGMSELQTVKTLLHELTHSVLHSEEALQKLPAKPDQQDAEIQAESTAFMVSALLGLDTSDYSFPYIATYCEGKAASKLGASMSLVRDTALLLYDRITAELGGPRAASGKQ